MDAELLDNVHMFFQALELEVLAKKLESVM
jgi:hypothetical protein